MASFSFLKGAALVGLLASSLSAAPQYYLFNGSNGFQIDPATGTVVNTFPVFDGGIHPAIVGNKIRLGSAWPGQGQEYDLSGTATAGVFDTSGNVFDQWLDGTSDGTYNYAVECCTETNRVYRTDLWWENSVALFDLPTFGLGITYDSVSNTLWVGLFDGTVRQYTMAGVEVSSFSTDGTPTALAYDALSDTIWLHERTGNNVAQFGKDGSLLQRVTIEGWDYYGVFGGEIYNAAVPEPGTFGLLTGALAGAFVAYRRRSS